MLNFKTLSDSFLENLLSWLIDLLITYLYFNNCNVSVYFVETVPDIRLWFLKQDKKKTKQGWGLGKTGDIYLNKIWLIFVRFSTSVVTSQPCEHWDGQRPAALGAVLLLASPGQAVPRQHSGCSKHLHWHLGEVVGWRGLIGHLPTNITASISQST